MTTCVARLVSGCIYKSVLLAVRGMAEDVSYSSPIDTEDLQSTATHFRRGANQVRKRMWWKDLKWKIIIAITILVILGAIIGKFLLFIIVKSLY